MAKRDNLREWYRENGYYGKYFENNDGTIGATAGKKSFDSLLALVDSEISRRQDPFDYVEPCEPECTKERHAYHQGQWDMAVRMKGKI